MQGRNQALVAVALLSCGLVVALLYSWSGSVPAANFPGSGRRAVDDAVHPPERDVSPEQSRLVTASRAPVEPSTDDLPVLTVRVVDEQEQPIDDAVLILPHPRAREPIPPDGISVRVRPGEALTVIGSGYVPATVLAPLDSPELVVVLERGRRVLVTVVDPGGSPVPGALVVLSTEGVLLPSGFEESFEELVPRPSPSETASRGFSNDQGIVSLQGLPSGEPLLCSAVRLGWIRTQDDFVIPPSAEEAKITLEPVYYAAVDFPSDDVVSYRIRGQLTSSGNKAEEQLSALQAYLRTRLPEAEAIWVGIGRPEPPRSIEFDFYSRSAGAVSVEAGTARLERVETIHLERPAIATSLLPPPGHGTAWFSPFGDASFVATLKPGDVVVRPAARGMAKVWFLSRLAIGDRCVFPEGRYEVHPSSSLLSDAFEGLPLAFKVDASLEKPLEFMVTRRVFSVEVAPVSSAGSPLSSFLLSASNDSGDYQAIVAANQRVAFRAPEGRLRLRLEGRAGSVYDEVVELHDALVLRPVLQ